ncbi:MAG: hypothetical protein IAE97_10650 [Chthoniobacterales bacterium]|nr:hypothetical protein [Chthoniobacterales bacterium]
MIPIPSPLHPAVVHFPIVLILIGMVCAVVSVFIQRWHLHLLAAVVLSTAAVGAVVATVTGGQDEEMAGELSGPAEHALEEHEQWGERTRNLALVAAAFAIGAAALSKVRLAGRSLSVITAVVSMAAAYSVAQAGHYGGQLVYRHGLGINTAGASDGDTGPAETQEWAHGHEDDD